jgi:hypothetical protein
MTNLMAPGRFYSPDDHVVLEVDIEDCPVADVPLTLEIFDMVNLVLLNDYLTVLKVYNNSRSPSGWMINQPRHYSMPVLSPSIEKPMAPSNFSESQLFNV